MPKRFLKFSDRWMFNRVLCEKEVCRKVLRAALGIEVGEITYLNAEQAKEPAAASRGVRMDVFAREGSRVFDIEMQVSPEDRIGRRMRYYQAAIDATELGPGEDYGLLLLALPQNQPNAPLYPAGGAPGSRPGALPHFGRPRYLGPPPRARSTAG